LDLGFQENFNENQYMDASIKGISNKIMESIGSVMVGQQQPLKLMIGSLLAGGHLLLEGVPGIAKTLMARLLASAVDVDFNRIQFTPDLLPGDALGSNLYRSSMGQFEFIKGPVFTNILLADEINRAPAKTQSALFEVMEEQQVTIDGKSYELPSPFMVVATQNPIELEGTYPLPEAQLDRFMIKIEMGFPTRAEEIEILHRFKSDFGRTTEKDLKPVVSGDDILLAKALVQAIFIKDELIEYLADLTMATRKHEGLIWGSSPRATLSVMKMSKAMAGLSGRDFVIPEDILDVIKPSWVHRLIIDPERAIAGETVEGILTEIIDSIPIPR
jgi:MoxR-like ATPase